MQPEKNRNRAGPDRKRPNRNRRFLSTLSRLQLRFFKNLNNLKPHATGYNRLQPTMVLYNIILHNI